MVYPDLLWQRAYYAGNVLAYIFYGERDFARKAVLAFDIISFRGGNCIVLADPASTGMLCEGIV